MNNDKITILLADDHQIVRMGLSTVIRLEDDMDVIGEARNGDEAVRRARELHPDVIVMDLMMPKRDGANATAAIIKGNPDAKVLLLTTFGASERVKAALDAGALGAIVKDTPYADIIKAIRRTAAGERVISKDIRHALEKAPARPELSERQLKVLHYVAQGLTTKTISEHLGIGPDGVNAHLRTIFAKLGVSSRSEAVAIALRKRLLQM